MNDYFVFVCQGCGFEPFIYSISWKTGTAILGCNCPSNNNFKSIDLYFFIHDKFYNSYNWCLICSKEAETDCRKRRHLIEKKCYCFECKYEVFENSDYRHGKYHISLPKKIEKCPFHNLLHDNCEICKSIQNKCEFDYMLLTQYLSEFMEKLEFIEIFQQKILKYKDKFPYSWNIKKKDKEANQRISLQKKMLQAFVNSLNFYEIKRGYFYENNFKKLGEAIPSFLNEDYLEKISEHDLLEYLQNLSFFDENPTFVRLII